ncbi:hypothetical protein MOQ_001796 [Trypanosoma cruzi marinkellei]|uniref:Uncharacterized protein n=1 Tax=Trypanosoma cruzi marinkellei TaxID=85056 RepID=K2MRT7_TRYCR|nr:hypothetical protein MOQ_001796 [Trypanosoma cruzi marinkellei]
MDDWGDCGEEAVHLRAVQQFLQAFLETPSHVVLLCTALGEMLGIVVRQQQSINRIIASLQKGGEERMQELTAVSQSFADILQDTIKRTALAISELREQIPKQKCTSGADFFSEEKCVELKREIGDLRRLVMERLQHDSIGVDMNRRSSAIQSELAATREKLRDIGDQQGFLLELLDLRKMLLHHGYTGDASVDLRQLRLLDTTAKVKLTHQLPCFHVLLRALLSTERHWMAGGASISSID